MPRLPHVPLLAVLGLGLAVTVGIGVSQQFQMFSSKGILSGPFSALVMLGAIEGTLFLLVLLDWRVWKPQREAMQEKIARWLAVDVLGNASAPAAGWQQITGRFRGCDVMIARTAVSGQAGLAWSAKTNSELDLSVVRLGTPSATAAGEYSSGDAEFDARYAWQTHEPSRALPLLKDEKARGALKRLATLFAQPGEFSDASAGVRVKGGVVSVMQSPAPTLVPHSFSPQEVLLILQDLTTLAMLLQGTPLPAAVPPPKKTSEAPEATQWLALGCAGASALGAWLGGTYLLAHLLGMAAAMVGFFIPPLALAVWAMVLAAGGPARDANIDRTIRTEAAAMVQGSDELAKLAARIADASG
jgi:hypothetical protein